MKTNNLVMLLPDGGAYKWGVKLADKIGFTGDVLACAKNRVYEDGKSKLKQQLPDFTFEGKDILIIDDICIYGGTFVGLAKMLRKRNAGKLYLAVSHITVEYPNPELFSLFDRVFTTNSKYDSYQPIPIRDGGFMNSDKLEVLKLFKSED